MSDPTCTNCGLPIGPERHRHPLIAERSRSPSGWTHVGAWEGIRCPGRITGACPPPCPVTYDHGPDTDGDPIERCRVIRPHHVHESAHGFYRWNDVGELVPTPHFSSPEFAALYEAIRETP